MPSDPDGAVVAARTQGIDELEQKHWNGIKDSRDASVFEEYLGKYPKGRYAGKARVMLTILKAQVRLPDADVVAPATGLAEVGEDSESRFWKEAKTRGGRDHLKAYLKQYPEGRYVPLAENELKSLAEREESGRAGEDAERKTQRELVDRENQEEARRHEEHRQRIEAERQALVVKQEVREAGKPAGEQTMGTMFKDCADCPEMVVIPAGSFSMGSPVAEAGRDGDEEPQHRVTIFSQFALAKTEITRRQFATFVKETGYATEGGCLAFANGKWERDAGRDWRSPGYPQRDNHPVVCVNWDDANAYVNWLARRTGKPYKLPSEAEWEYAARAGTKAARYWGEDRNLACGYANVMDATGKAKVPGVTWGVHNCRDGHAYTSPTRSFKPNGFGVYDMIGNVWEWTEDCWNDSYRVAPRDGSAWTTGDCSKRVLRGGSWDNEPRFARAAIRYKTETTTRFNTGGFRPARMLP